MHPALKVTVDVLLRVLCVNCKETNTFFRKAKYFLIPSFTLLISSFRLTLLNVFFNNLPISLQGPLNCICTRGTIKVNVFLQKSIDHIRNYVQKSFFTAWKVTKYRVFSGLYFPGFGLNTEIFYSVNLCIQSNGGKYEPEKTLYLDTKQCLLWVLSRILFSFSLIFMENLFIKDLKRRSSNFLAKEYDTCFRVIVYNIGQINLRSKQNCKIFYCSLRVHVNI